jgi:hypothetical protein
MKNYDGRAEEFAGHAEPEQELGIPDIVGRSGGVSPHDQHAGDIQEGKWGGQTVYEI